VANEEMDGLEKYGERKTQMWFGDWDTVSLFGCLIDFVI